jgi:riboflavin synthase
MFTGIVEEIGTVREATPNRLVIEAQKVLEGTKTGDSIAVNGVCLTVTSLGNRKFGVDVMPETLRRSNLGQLYHGDRVNLERALAISGRLGGHLVLGHVDGVGRVESVTPQEAASIMRISLPSELTPYTVNKGFIAIDGISLTIVDIDNSSFTVSLVAYTLENTTLGNKRPGDIVNLEVDIIAKYVERLMSNRNQGLSLDFLKEYGFVERSTKY